MSSDAKGIVSLMNMNDRSHVLVIGDKNDPAVHSVGKEVYRAASDIAKKAVFHEMPKRDSPFEAWQVFCDREPTEYMYSSFKSGETTKKFIGPKHWDSQFMADVYDAFGPIDSPEVKPEDAVVLTVVTNPTDEKGSEVRFRIPYIGLFTGKTAALPPELCYNARQGHAPGFIPAMLKALRQDPCEQYFIASELAEVLREARSLHITSPAGTNLITSLQGYRVKIDAGPFYKPGTFGNIPRGEAYGQPVLDDFTNGVFVCDGTSGIGMPKSPITLDITCGQVTDIRCDDKDILKQVKATLAAKGGSTLGELGVGVNPHAWLMGNMLLDEKVYSTVHIAVGEGEGNEDAEVHEDFLTKNAYIAAYMPNGQRLEVMIDGEFNESVVPRPRKIA